jgi:hypothetical protein
MNVRRLLSLVTLCAMAAAMASVAMPGPAAAATEARVNFDLTVNGPSPSGDSLQLFLKNQSQKTGQILPYCAPHSCQGGGKVYSITLSAPSGTTGSYRFEVVGVDGTVTVLRQGNFTEPAGPEGVQLTINVTYNVGGLPDAAVAPKADRPGGMLRALGVLMLLIAATVLTRTAGRKREVWRLGAGG